MTDMLKRAHAPISSEAWKAIDDTAKRVLATQLTARNLVDFDGPHGWEFAAVNLGRLTLARSADAHGVPWGTRAVLPVVEARVPVLVDRMELDNISRGRQDVDFDALEDAVRKVALFEESAVYLGFSEDQMPGMIGSSSHTAIRLPAEASEYPEAVAECVRQLTDAGMPGPYALVLGPEPFAALTAAGAGGYPALPIVREILGGDVRGSAALTGGIVLSTIPGNFRLSVGQDFSIGYTDHDHDRVELFITESFAFQVLESRAAIQLQSP